MLLTSGYVLIAHVRVKLGSKHTVRCDTSKKNMMYLSPGWCKRERERERERERREKKRERVFSFSLSGEVGLDPENDRVVSATNSNIYVIGLAGHRRHRSRNFSYNKKLKLDSAATGAEMVKKKRKKI